MIFESPDGGKTVYSRKPGETERTLHHIDELVVKELTLSAKVDRLKQAVYLDDPAINDLLDKIEVLMQLKK